MKYEDCKYLKINEYNSKNNKECYLSVKFADELLPIIIYTYTANNVFEKQFFNYLPYLRMYKQRIIDNMRQGNSKLAAKYIDVVFAKTEKNFSIPVNDSNYLPSGWAKLIEQLYVEVVKFNTEYEEAKLESQIRNS